MNEFELLKDSITVLQAAERYGVVVGRNGMINCLFHEDHHPSMKLNERYFYCFGCSAHGDVIDFTARLLGRSIKETVSILLRDFCLEQRFEHERLIALRPSALEPIRQDIDSCYKVLIEYMHMLQQWKEQYAPLGPDVPIPDRYIIACQQEEFVGYALDILMGDSRDERTALVNSLIESGKIEQLRKTLEGSREVTEMRELDKSDAKWPEWYDGQKIDEARFVKAFLSEHPMICVQGEMFSVDGRIPDDVAITKIIYDMIKPVWANGLARKAKSLMESIKMECYSEPLAVEQDRIHFANGTLLLDGQFVASKTYCINRLPVRYDPTAVEPVTWLRFLEDLLFPEDIPTLQEYMGYCLIPSTKGQKMLIIRGKGGEGKSRIGIVMRAIFGVSLKNGSIAKIENSPFARADLEHVLVLVDDDMKLEALPQTHYIKSIVTAEMPLDLEKKGVQSYQGRIFARLMAFGNGDLRAMYDHSNAFYRRQLILTAKDRTKGREDDPYIAEKMCAEAEGIVLWALEGLKRLLANNYVFTESERARASVEEVRKEGNNVIDFLSSEGYIQFKSNVMITSKELYAIYQIWCEDNEVKPMAAKTLSAYLISHASEYNIEYSNNATNAYGRRVRGFCGIEALLRPESRK